MEDKIIFLFPISSTVKLPHFGYHFVPNNSPSWFTHEQQTVFLQQHSITCSLRNKRFRRAETCNTHVGQVLESILAKKTTKGFWKNQNCLIQHL